MKSLEVFCSLQTIWVNPTSSGTRKFLQRALYFCGIHTSKDFGILWSSGVLLGWLAILNFTHGIHSRSFWSTLIKKAYHNNQIKSINTQIICMVVLNLNKSWVSAQLTLHTVVHSPSQRRRKNDSIYSLVLVFSNIFTVYIHHFNIKQHKSAILALYLHEMTDKPWNKTFFYMKEKLLNSPSPFW